MVNSLPEDMLAELWTDSRIDFSEVTLHECSAPSIGGACAVACGSHLVFARHCCEPNTEIGRKLIRHELMHSVQQWNKRGRIVAGLLIDAEDENQASDFATDPTSFCVGSSWKLPSFVPEPLMWQPAIGFEFQIGWNAYRKETVVGKKLGLFKKPMETRLVPFPRATCLYGGRGTTLGWSMETDGREIEFVIDPPISEDEQGQFELQKIFQTLNSFLDRLEAARDEQELTPASHPSFFSLDTSGELRDVVIIPNGRIRAQPQITIGVRLGRIPDLFAEMGRAVPNTYFERTPGTDFYQRSANRLSNISLQLPPVARAAASNKLRGLVAMVSQYLIQGIAGGQRAYAKDMAFAMGRTDFAAMFNLLPEAERSYFSAIPNRWVAYCLTAANMPNSGQEKLLNQRITDNLDGPGVQLGLTRDKWLRDMASGVDRFTKAGSPDEIAADQSHRLRALGLLGFQFDPVGRARTKRLGRHDGVVIELRQLRRDVPYSQWNRVARDVYGYIKALNESSKLDQKPTLAYR